MTPNFPALIVAALIPLIVGFIWYNPKIFGTAWMKACKFTEDDMKGANMPLIFGLTFLFSLMFSFLLPTLVVHQWNAASLFVGHETEATEAIVNTILTDYGSLHRTVTHGLVHGIFLSLFFVLPIIGINALFERRGWKYILIHLGYWLIVLSAMSVIHCAWV